MSKIIDFLEKLGQDAGLRQATDTAMEHAMTRAGIEPALQTAILNKDQYLLESLLGADTNVCCLVHIPGDGDGFEDDDEAAAKENKEDEKVKSYRADSGRVA